jgi:hypothetical protein
MRNGVSLALFALLILPLVSLAQIAAEVDAGSVAVSAAGGRRATGSVAVTGDAWGIQGRAIGSRWDAGATYRALQHMGGSGGVATFWDLGGTALYGSEGPKAAAVGGVLFGDSSKCYFWAKGTLGNFRALSGGFAIGRANFSGSWSSYFESRVDLGVLVWQPQEVSVVAGYGTAAGFTAGLRKVWTWRH